MNGLFIGINVFMWFVGLGTLMAGIVGISNIMIITVKERTREIGVRKALGATPFSIVSTLLLESALVTGVAGYVGLVFGVGLLELMAFALRSSGAKAPYFLNPESELPGCDHRAPVADQCGPACRTHARAAGRQDHANRSDACGVDAMFIDIEKWREIFKTLSQHKLRTSLTAFGVFWGIFMLTVLLGAGKGLENGVNDGFPRVTNTIFIWEQGPTQMPYQGMPIGRQIQLVPADVDAIAQERRQRIDASKGRIPWASGAAARRTRCTNRRTAPSACKVRSQASKTSIRCELRRGARSTHWTSSSDARWH